MTLSYNASVLKFSVELIAWRFVRKKKKFRWCKNALAYDSRANPTIVIYNAMSSLVHFENKNVFFYVLWKNALAYYV
jgi:hypothetical protein